MDAISIALFAFFFGFIAGAELQAADHRWRSAHRPDAMRWAKRHKLTGRVQYR